MSERNHFPLRKPSIMVVIGMMVMRMVWCNNDDGEEEGGLDDGNGGAKDGDEEGTAWQCTRRQLGVRPI